ncbi:hypothetical protein LY78DRAFT_710613 [Colletotrichum sublineola]|nr:hypothetical protein LY78DRAFT_710613 [Colletotrichum sublineola]
MTRRCGSSHQQWYYLGNWHRSGTDHWRCLCRFQSHMAMVFLPDPLCLVGLFSPVYLAYLPSVARSPGESTRSLLKSIDFVGAIMSIGAITSLVLAINLGRSLFNWNSPQIIALFAVAGGLFVVFVFQQAFSVFTTAERRIFPVPLLLDIDAVLLFVATAGANAAAFIPIYYIPLYFQFTRGDRAVSAAVRLLPLIVPLCVFVLVNGRLMARFNYIQPWYILGSSLALIGCILMSQIKTNSSLASIYGYEIMIGAGTGSFLQCGYAIIQHVVQPGQRPHAIGFMMLAQLGGIVLSLAIAGSIFINHSLSGLGVLMPDVPRSTLQQAISGTSSDYFRSLPPNTQEQSIEIIVGGLAKTFIPAYVGASSALLWAAASENGNSSIGMINKTR